MKVRYGKGKTPIVFGVGGVIVAMVTTFFCGNILEPVTSAVFTRLSWNLAHRTNITWRCEKSNFRNCCAKRCHGNHTYRGKIISFSFSFCSSYPIGMKFGTQDRYNMALWKIEFSKLLHQALPWQPHISGKIISLSFSFCSFYPISDHLQIWHEGALW